MTVMSISAHKGDEQVGRTLFFDKCTGVGGQVVQGVD